MNDYDWFIIARAVHVLSVVMWIGGVAFITTVLLPAMLKHIKNEQRFTLFEQLEHSFSWQAKLTTIAAGVSGFYMLYFLNAWHRYLYVEFWWLHLMTIIWLIFSIVLFVLEPLFLHKWFENQAKTNSKQTFITILRMHRVLLFLSLLAVAGAVLGSHGGLPMFNNEY
ncbi:hypothetical protein [Litorilituus lipolyticus]|uniref:DUF2269 family protein n=1 Tax=Litorilituus lipolyticus TaxID=2491017 RepID=A0A502KUL1_9GAMM|nr:hypothetical protein [Litorilituus lipolyticus]TPH13343.1 hypothetical protein EPA86_14220 [Litorilituus lipolyticus]